jgi:hypothetical protein
MVAFLPVFHAPQRWKNEVWSEALIIYGIHEYNRRIHKYLYVFMKFKEITAMSPVS